MTNSFNSFDIETIIQEYAKSNVKCFYPSAIQKVIKLPIDKIIEKLLDMTKENKLKLLSEIKCPECYRTCLVIDGKEDIYDLAEDIYDLNIECDLGHEFEINNDNIFPLFELNDEYK